jgi:hypothetical protein
MPRGGYQKPSKPAAVSGPGKMSKRTDGGVQAVREPDIDTQKLEYGDRQMIADAQKVAPLPKGQTAVDRRPQGAPMNPGELPDWLVDMDTNRPDEPVTTGLGLGPGAGPEALDAAAPSPDMREQILEGLFMQYQDPNAHALLQQLRAERMTTPAPGGPLG